MRVGARWWGGGEEILGTEGVEAVTANGSLKKAGNEEGKRKEKRKIHGSLNEKHLSDASISGQVGTPITHFFFSFAKLQVLIVAK